MNVGPTKKTYKIGVLIENFVFVVSKYFDFSTHTLSKMGS
jgi:hypothetical protein